MTREEIKNNLGRIIRTYMDPQMAKTFDPNALTGQEHLRNDLNVDSADVVEIVLDIESEFSIVIDDASIEKLTTVNDIMNLIEEEISLHA